MVIALVLAAMVFAGDARPQQRVAFCGVELDKQNLYVINLDGTGLKQITTSPAEDIDPAWSPDGSTLLFTRVPSHDENESRPNGHLWIVRPDGTGLKQLTSGPVFDTGAWSPDGKRVVFHRPGPEPGKYEIDPRTKRVKWSLDQAWRASFSPDGRRIASIISETSGEDDHRSDLWLSSSPGKKGKRLTNFKTSFSEPQWSPDGKNLAFKIERPPGQSPGDALCIMPIAGGKMKVIVSGQNNYVEDPRWSPDGKLLCFLEAKDDDPMSNASFRQLYVISPDGSGRRRLTDHWGNDYLPQWTRDGKSIVVQGERGMRRVDGGGVTGEPTSNLIVVDLNGKDERILPTGLPVYGPVLSP